MSHPLQEAVAGGLVEGIQRLRNIFREAAKAPGWERVPPGLVSTTRKVSWGDEYRVGNPTEVPTGGNKKALIDVRLDMPVPWLLALSISDVAAAAAGGGQFRVLYGSGKGGEETVVTTAAWASDGTFLWGPSSDGEAKRIPIPGSRLRVSWEFTGRPGSAVNMSAWCCIAAQNWGAL